MEHKREYETYERVGVESPRSYYIPFSQSQDFAFKHGDRKSVV